MAPGSNPEAIKGEFEEAASPIESPIISKKTDPAEMFVGG
jgi:hypothetical protein